MLSGHDEPLWRRRGPQVAALCLLLVLALVSTAQPQRHLQNPIAYAAAGSPELGIQLSDAFKVLRRDRFPALLAAAAAHPRKRRMTDLTLRPEQNSLQVLLNTWTEESYSPVHAHARWSESFIVLDGALALFTWDYGGVELRCTVLSPGGAPVALAEAGTWHAMAAAPRARGWPGHAVVLEQSGHRFDARDAKQLAPFAPSRNGGMDGEPAYFQKLFESCARFDGVQTGVL